jgi:hypothetical protein
MNAVKRTIAAIATARTARVWEVIAYIAAIGWLAFVFVMLAALAQSAQLSTLGLGLALLIAILVAGVGATGLTWLADLFGQHARDIGAKSIFDQLRRGEAPAYTLYLRPFAATDQIADSVSAAMIGPGALIAERVELEHQIERAVRRVGPLVALGQPLEHIGAGRIRVADAEWRDAIRLLMSKARLIVMLPSSRTGTLEEIGMILGSELIQRTVLIDPPNLRTSRKYNQEKEWRRVQEAFTAANLTLPDDAKRGALVFYGDDSKADIERLDIDADDRIAAFFRNVLKQSSYSVRGETA